MTTLLIGLEKESVTGAHLAQIKQAAPELDVLISQDPHEIEAVVEDIEIAAGWLPPDLLLNLPNLRWYQQWAAGADWLMAHPKAYDHPFVLTTGSGIHPIGISEQIFSYLLGFARALPAAYRAQLNHVWEHPRQGVFELAGKTMVLIGLGNIGARTARLAIALEMRVIGVDRNPLLQVQGVEKIVDMDQLQAVLPEGDFVVMTIPHTPHNTHTMGPAEFATMKQGAYFVNIGRGKTVDEAALIAALQSGDLAGAGLDVFETEPLPADSPLWDMENVIITAHYAGLTPAYQERAMAIFVENLRRYQAGEALHNVVDKQLGY